jgi:hypothetical protein
MSSKWSLSFVISAENFVKLNNLVKGKDIPVTGHGGP